MTIASLNTAGGPLLSLGYPGQPADDQECSIMSRINESTTGGSTTTPGLLDFGIAVARGSTTNSCKRLDTDTLPIGITVRSLEMSPNGANEVGYWPTFAVGIMYQGDIFVEAVETVTDGDAVYALVSEGGGLGGITSGGASADRILLPNAHWCSEPGASSNVIAAGAIGRVRMTGVNNPTTST